LHSVGDIKAKPELHEVQEGPSVHVIQLGTAEHETQAKLAEHINTKSTSGSVSHETALTSEALL
jgi:hypothetical protein